MFSCLTTNTILQYKQIRHFFERQSIPPRGVHTTQGAVLGLCHFVKGGKGTPKDHLPNSNFVKKTACEGRGSKNLDFETT